MGLHSGPSCYSKAEPRISDTVRELRSQLEKSKEKFHELKGRFLLSEATVYSMANELKKHNCRKFKNMIESVLGMKLQYKEKSLAEKLNLAENLRGCSFHIQDEDQKLSLFHQKLQQGRHASFFLCQHLKDLLAWDDPNTTEGHIFHELLAVGCSLAEDLVQVLSPEHNDDEDSEIEYDLLTPRMSPDGADKDKVDLILQASLHADPKSSSHCYNLCNTKEPPGDLTDDPQLFFSLDETYPQEAGIKDKEAEHVVLRDLQKHQDEYNVLKDKMNKNFLAVSQCWDLCDSNQPGKHSASMTEEDVAPYNLNMAKKQDNEDNEKEQEDLALGLSTEGVDKDKVTAILPDSLGEGPKTCSHEYDLPDNHETCCTVAVLSDAHKISSSLDVAQNTHDWKDEGPQPKASRKYSGIIHYHAKKLTHLRKQLREGRDASLSLEQHLEFLLAQDDPKDYCAQGHIQHLAQGCKMAEDLVLKLSVGNNEQANEEKEGKDLIPKMDDLDGDFQFLIEVQAQELTKLRHKLEEERHTASTLHENLSSLLTEDDEHRCQNQSHREILVEGSKLAKCIAHRFRSDNLDDEDEDDQTTMGFSLCEQEENKLGPDSLDEKYLLPSCLPDEPEPDECTSIATFPSQKPEDHSELDGSKLHLDACLGMRGAPMLVGCTLENSAAITHAFPIQRLCDVDSVLKQKITKRNVCLFKWKIACRFPGLHD